MGSFNKFKSSVVGKLQEECLPSFATSHDPPCNSFSDCSSGGWGAFMQTSKVGAWHETSGKQCLMSTRMQTTCNTH